MKTETNEKIPRETLTLICDMLKRYVSDISEDKILSLVNSKVGSKTNKVLLSTKEVLEYLGISYMTLHRSKQKGEINFIKTNPNKSGRCLYELSEIDRWLDSKKTA